MTRDDLYNSQVALQSIEAAVAYDGEDEDLFLRNEMQRDASLMRLLVAGEYAGKVTEEVKALHPSQIWQQAKRARNYYAHAYGGVNRRHVFETIQAELPNLRTLLLSVQRDLEKDQHATN